MTHTQYAVQSSRAPAPVGPYSQALVAGDFVFVSGQIPLSPDSKQFDSSLPIEEQSSLVLRNIQEILKELKLDFSSLVKVEIFLTDLSEFSKVNAVYSTFFEGITTLPARVCVQVTKLPLGVDIEISCIAFRGEKHDSS
ncbi:MAG: hypothetical protein H6500_00460 [Candidatus Woesearchaeota archaeon]|nr:Rid family detoxifying hydrolase [Nanoarchaeota archaeon]USN44305.1 MAG: hypothetical protein H6500_00460 [Candidatus Woesearchaeota archaeon]